MEFKRTGDEDFPTHIKALVTGQPKTGKALRVDQPILMADGTFKVASDVKEGDLLVGSDGTPTSVVGVYPQGLTDAWEVTTDDGASVVVSGDHLWHIMPHASDDRVETTDRIRKILADGSKRVTYIPVMGAMELPDRDLPIDPYSMGILLGDGSFVDSTVKVTNEDGLINEIVHPKGGLIQPFGGNSARINNIYDIVEDLGLKGAHSVEKFIPNEYLIGSIRQRRALLAGLLDTDGGVNGKSTCFYTSSESMKNDVLHLVRSLGGVASVATDYEPTYTYREEERVGNVAYTLSIRLPEEFGCPFRLERKREAWLSTGTRKRRPTRRIVAVERAEHSAETVCFKVDALDELFVVNDFIVTHNTTFAATFPNVIMAAVEDGLQSIAHKDIAYVEIDSRNKLLQLATMLADDGLRKRIAKELGMDKVESVAIDTLDVLQELMKSERLKEMRRQDFQRDDWGWLKDEMTMVVRKFVSLPLHVVLTVHATTGQDDEGRLVIRPAFQGSFQDKVAGEVGYSLLTQRETTIEQKSGKKKAVYSVLTEGDETRYPDLGNRAAGRLERVIEPDFEHLHKAVYEGLKIARSQRADVDETSDGSMGGVPEMKPTDGSDSEQPAEEAQTEAQRVAGESRTVEIPDPEPEEEEKPKKAEADTEITPAAISHLQKMVGEFGVDLSPGVTHGESWTIGEAREVGKFVVQAKRAHAEGQVDDLKQTVVQGLIDMGAVTPVVGEPGVAVPTGTVDEVVEWANTDARRQSALAHELGKKDDGRSTLKSRLKSASDSDLSEDVDAEDVAEAAEVPDDAEPPPLKVVKDESEDEPEASGEEPEPEPEAEDADESDEADDEESPEPPSLEEASALIEEELGGKVVDENEDDDPRLHKECEHCGKTAAEYPDEFDLDVAELGEARYRKFLCITGYMKERSA